MHAIVHLVVSILFFMSFASNLHLALAAPLGEISARHNFPPPTQPAGATQNESMGAFSGPAGNAEGGSVHKGTAQNDGSLLGELQNLELVDAFSSASTSSRMLLIILISAS